MSDLLAFSASPDALLLESAARLGVPLASYYVNPWPGWAIGKLKRGLEFLSTQYAPVIMWVDGHDSLILKPASEIIYRFLSFNCRVLISAERNCFPDPEKHVHFPEHEGPRYPCAGGFIGYRDDVMSAMEAALRLTKTDNDQQGWTDGIISGEIPAVVDSGRLVFCSEGDGDTQEADPAVRHWNGRVPGRDEWWRVYCSK